MDTLLSHKHTISQKCSLYEKSDNSWKNPELWREHQTRQIKTMESLGSPLAMDFAPSTAAFHQEETPELDLYVLTFLKECFLFYQTWKNPNKNYIVCPHMKGWAGILMPTPTLHIFNRLRSPTFNFFLFFLPRPQFLSNLCTQSFNLQVCLK